MEVIDGVLSVGKVGDGFPSVFGIIVSLPVDEVLEASAEASGVLDVIDLVLLVTVHEVWRRWRRGNLVRKDGGFERMQEISVERAVSSSGRARESETIRGPTDLGIDGIGSDASGIQLLRGSRGREVRGVQPDQVSQTVVDGVITMEIIEEINCVLGLSEGTGEF